MTAVNSFAETFDRDGIRLAFDDRGAGEALVLIHGHPFDRSMWHPQAARFSAAGWRVITPDLRGYGQSGTDGAAMTTLDVFAGDIEALLDHLGVPSAVLCGLSMGGQIVMECLRSFPERIRAAVLADTTPHAETATGRLARNLLADQLVLTGMDDYAHEVLAKMVDPANLRAQPAVAEHVLTMMRRTDPDGAAAALRGRAVHPDYQPVLAAAGVPMQVVVGDRDTFTPVEAATEMAAGIPGARLAVIADAAHLPNLERPEAFDAVLAEFLRSLATV